MQDNKNTNVNNKSKAHFGFKFELWCTLRLVQSYFNQLGIIGQIRLVIY